MTTTDDRARPPDLRSFGRRRGRRPRARQSDMLARALPRYALDLGHPPPPRLGDLFAAPVGDVWLEIGFGGGEHIICQAMAHPHVGLIGCEPFEDGVVKTLAAAEARGLRNLRLHGDDARPLLRWLPPASLGRVFILFPDPWPKARHQKRRLVNVRMIELLARVTQSGAELRLATDVDDYARAMLIALEGHGGFEGLAWAGSDWRDRPPDWPRTRYEEKATAAGRDSSYLRFIRSHGV